MTNFTVSLDLDETLIHSTEERLEGAKIRFGDFWTKPRPHLDLFLKDLSGFSQIGFYTHASQAYASRFIEQFCPWLKPKFVLSRENCVKQWPVSGFDGLIGSDHFKDLKKAVEHRHDLDRLIAVDDRPYLYPRQYGNVVGVPAFLGRDDDVLLRLLKYLRWLSDQKNVRNIEKRGWIYKFNHA
jgi:TFIIF-interacting CTD phosphatase-like protein